MFVLIHATWLCLYVIDVAASGIYGEEIVCSSRGVDETAGLVRVSRGNRQSPKLALVVWGTVRKKVAWVGG